jgi:alkylation response protein AidB-like acyl-CoA dehydrogenase
MGDHGQKIFTTHAHDADYIWLAARTDPEAPKHKGISIILVPTDTPGFSCTPIQTLGGERTNATYYEGVRVPVASRVGPEHEGWRLVTSQLNHERITLATPGVADRVLDEVWSWAAATDAPDGGRMLDVAWVQLTRPCFRQLEALSSTGVRRGRSAPASLTWRKRRRSRSWGLVLRQCYRDLLESRRRHRATASRGSRRLLESAIARHGDLRRRRERGAARHHRDGRPRPAARAAALIRRAETTR